MRKQRPALLCVLAFCGVAELEAAIQVSEDIKKSVVFMYGQNKDGTTGACSGFLVGVPAQPARTSLHTYLVTARHCLRENKNGDFYSRVHVRVNRTAGGALLIPTRVTVEGLGRNVHLHPDPNVDLAVIEFRVDPAVMDVRVIPPELLTDRDSLEKAQITEGTDVFFAGLFTSYPGNERNYPIVRFGRVALVTPEVIQWAEGVKSNLYLIEATAFGGNSGAPVFFYLSTDRIAGSVVVGPPAILLAGVMTLAFEDDRPVRTSDPPAPRSVHNLGVAGVTPSFYLRELLFSEGLRKDRGE